MCLYVVIASKLHSVGSGQLPAPISFRWNVVVNRGFIITFTCTNRLPSGSEFFSMASSHADMDNAIATAAHFLGYVLKPEQRTRHISVC